MGYIKQMLYLVKQELNSARRSRYIILSFVILPFFMWGLEGGAQALIGTFATATPTSETIYITNQDENGTINLPVAILLPFNFSGHTAGDVILPNTQFSLSTYLVSYIKWVAKNDNTSALYNTNIVDNKSIDELNTLKDKGNVDYWLQINSSFSQIYSNKNVSIVQVQYLQQGLVGYSPITNSIYQILNSRPFTIVTVEKYSNIETSYISIGGEETGISFGIGLAGLLAILLSVMAPAPFVSTAFAGEREKKTLESLLALPISRKSILLGKLLSGMVLVAIFAVLNVFGMYFYNWIISLSNSEVSSVMSFDLTTTTIIAISIVMFLSAFISIGLGISIASFAKDVRTSESMYQLILMFPSMIVGFAGMFAGVPESIGGPALLLYIIPYTHTLAIFQKLLKPNYYDVKSLTGFGLYGDLLFHFAYLFISILIVLYIASKVFEREGIVN